MNAFLPATAAPSALEPERDEQVRAEPHALPPEERHEEASSRARARASRQQNRFMYAKKRAEALVAVHVADREDVDERADAGDEEDQRHRERVDQEAHVDVERARRQPGEDRRDVAARGLGEVVQREEASPATRGTRPPSARSRATPAIGSPQLRPEQHEHRRADERQQRHDPDQVEQVSASRHASAAQPCSDPEVVGGRAATAPEDGDDDRQARPPPRPPPRRA